MIIIIIFGISIQTDNEINAVLSVFIFIAVSPN